MMTILHVTHVSLHKGFARVHYSDGGRLIVSTNEALRLADRKAVPIVRE